MRRNTYSLLIFLIALILFSISCNRNTGNSITQRVQLKDPGHSAISIVNHGDSTSVFTMKINGYFFETFDEMLHQIRKDAGFNKNKIYWQAWKFVCDNTYRAASISGEKWIEDPVLYLNSVGFGWCDKESILLSQLWKKLGYPSRIWNLNGHVVPEVYYSNAWHMMDPSFRVYYYNPQGAIASVEELSQNPHWITQAYKGPIKEASGLPAYTSALASLYSSVNDNFSYVRDEQDSIVQFTIALPPHSRFDFPGIYVQNPSCINGATIQYYANGRITVPPDWQGTLPNHLLPAAVNGQGRLIANQKEYVIQENELNRMLAKPNELPKCFVLGDHNDSVEFIYYLNPYFASLNHKNKIVLKGSHLGHLTIQSSSRKVEEAVEENLKNKYFFFEAARVRLMHSSTHVCPCRGLHDSIRSTEEILNTLRLYCRCKKMSLTETNNAVAKMDKIIQAMPADYDRTRLTEAFAYLPRELAFWDIIHSDERLLQQVLYRLCKP